MMTILALLLAASGVMDPITKDADGGIIIIDAERAVIVMPDTNHSLPKERTIEVGSGTYVMEKEWVREGADHAALRVDNQNLREHCGDIPTSYLVGAVGTGTIIGAVVTAILWGAFHHDPPVK